MTVPEMRPADRRSSMPQALRFDGAWWREFGRLGCVYGPDWWKRYSPPVIAAIIFLLVRRNRDGARANLTRVLGSRGWGRDMREVLRLYTQFAHCFTETHEAYGPRPAVVDLQPPAVDHLAATLAGGRGAVVVTAHFGNSDIAALGMARYGRPVTMVMAREANVTATPVVESLLASRGVRVVYGSDSPLRALDLRGALRNGEIVGIQLDGHALAPGATLVDFFGRPAGFHLGPFLLARAARAPLLPVFVIRTGRRRYAIRLLGRYEPRTIIEAHEALRQVVAGFESLVREHPHQWFQFADFWTPAPRGWLSRSAPAPAKGPTWPDGADVKPHDAVPG
jgi:KDO2-lipid IV(A) lauroyltransferase